MAIAIPTITSEGEPIDPAIAIVSFEVHKALDRITEARLVVRDGSAAKREFTFSDGEQFAPGKLINIKMRRGDEVDVQLFEGLVVRHRVEAASGRTVLQLELKDAAFKLTRQRKSAVHREQTDDEVMRTLIEGAGLKVGTLDATTGTQHELIQYYASDWDFLRARADINGLVVVVEDGTISARKMSEGDAAKLKLEWGLDPMHEFEFELDGTSQWGKVTGSAWDLQQQARSTPVEAEPVELAAGNLDVDAAVKLLGAESYDLLVPSWVTPDELQAWANARFTRSRLALLRGHMILDGRSDILPFDRLDLGGVGERFNGTLLVSEVIHRFDHEGWRTELRFGLSPDWFARTPDIADVPAGGLVPPVAGLQVGLVDAFEADPDGEQRIKVRLPALDDQQGSVWARLARPDAGKERGFTFWPEVEDEVVVGFLADDPRQAVILGALHGSANPPPKPVGEPSEANPKRAIVSKSGIVVAFDDEKVVLTIETPKKNTIVIDDDAEAVQISDKHGNTITMDSKGIKLVSASDFAVEAKGKVVLKGSAVDVQ